MMPIQKTVFWYIFLLFVLPLVKIPLLTMINPRNGVKDVRITNRKKSICITGVTDHNRGDVCAFKASNGHLQGFVH